MHNPSQVVKANVQTNRLTGSRTEKERVLGNFGDLIYCAVVTTESNNSRS